MKFKSCPSQKQETHDINQPSSKRKSPSKETEPPFSSNPNLTHPPITFLTHSLIGSPLSFLPHSLLIGRSLIGAGRGRARRSERQRAEQLGHPHYSRQHGELVGGDGGDLVEVRQRLKRHHLNERRTEPNQPLQVGASLVSPRVRNTTGSLLTITDPHKHDPNLIS